MKSGFVTLVGRPNAGKSTLVNTLLGTKVSIVSDKPQTTRLRVMGVLHRPASQIVLVDTPGIHKPVTRLGERLNETAQSALTEVDVACLVIDATASIGRGDRFIAEHLPPESIVVLTKCDRASPDMVVQQLAEASLFDAEAYFPVSGLTGEGLPALVEHLENRLSEGPAYFPADQITDLPEPWFIAELVREQLLSRFHDELPYSIATRVTEWDGPRIRCEILVERESQKGMVIGRNGDVLKQVGIAVRSQLANGGEGIHLELRVKVDKDWQRKSESLDRLLDFQEPD
ncbi:MAG: GTPase Era [Actinobacteria bacterium]|jgi:GTP-binding protein Era|nr:GTPase Era [Actinomycetota bacterium]MCS5689178.1 GTPase Era [Acidimicrobiales bacterium]MED5552697.1 GTPase Era [Actinomycetota bacterium]MEE3187190.1 GTPase Era [Actinomycetota bacterium]HJM21503.1 GTPase Era [Acidimicrobiales bacterium]|tara:strand:+ start:6647 stop:7507 length:861 start_codon:yes stop_codon:yes gene_type:complete